MGVRPEAREAMFAAMRARIAALRNAASLKRKRKRSRGKGGVAKRRPALPLSDRWSEGELQTLARRRCRFCAGAGVVTRKWSPAYPMVGPAKRACECALRAYTKMRLLSNSVDVAMLIRRRFSTAFYETWRLRRRGWQRSGLSRRAFYWRIRQIEARAADMLKEQGLPGGNSLVRGTVATT